MIAEKEKENIETTTDVIPETVEVIEITTFKNNIKPHLILYVAPTGTSTGLSNTPIALPTPIEYDATKCIMVSWAPGNTADKLFGATLTLALI